MCLVCETETLIATYTYDANGNRATITQNGSTTTYTYDANNRLLAETAVIPTLYYYDANGNTIGIMKGGDPAGAYAYNLFGNQVSYTPNGVLYIYYTYRPDGLRHSIDDKIHVWDGANIVADVDGNDVSVYIRGANLIYADDGNIIYYHFNAHGDVVVLTNANGTKTKSYSYSAFGIEYNESALDDNPFRYCGEYFDKETQTIYLRARYYDAEQGRFTQEDPIRDGDNWYSYCGGNPVMFVDPTGLSKGLSKKTQMIMEKLSEYRGDLDYIAPPSTNFPVEQQNDISGGLVIAAGISMAADGPLLVGDVVSVVLLGIAAAIATMTASTAVTTAPPISLPEIRIKSKSEERVATKIETDTKTKNESSNSQIILYRYYASKTENLSPRVGKDYDGLSFSTLPPRPGIKAVMTTVDAINATGILKAIPTSSVHYIIVPTNATVTEWMVQGQGSLWSYMLSTTVIEITGGV